MNISIHDARGQFLQIISCPVSHIALQEIPEEGGYVEGAWDGRYWWAIEGEAFPRPEMSCTLDKPSIAADGIEVVTLSGLPIPCTLTLTDPEGKVSTFELETDMEMINTDLAGTHKIKVRAWPYLDWEGSFDGY